MKIPRHYSLAVATAVVETVERMITNEKVVGELTVYSFSNGSEQGLAIKRDWGVETEGRQVCIAEHKVDGSIIIYHGPSAQFDSTTNHPVNWDWCSYFAYDNYGDAARFVLEYLFYGEDDT